MYTAMCFLIPSFISIQCENKMMSKKTNYISLLINYGIYLLINNTVSLAILNWLFDINSNYQANISTYSGIAVKYSIISIVVAIILALIKILIVKNLEVKIEVEDK